MGKFYDILLAKQLSGGSGPGPTPPSPAGDADDVRFFDYYGDIIYQYSAEEFLALDDMPEVPSDPPGLVAQGWNWSFDDAVAQVESSGFLDIGQMYATESGATEIDVHITNEAQKVCGVGLYDTTGVTIDWGDGTTDNVTDTPNTKVRTTHTYASTGYYTIKIDGTYRFAPGTYNQYSGLFGDTSGTKRSPIQAGSVLAIRIGDGISQLMNTTEFYGFSNMQYITMPNTLTSVNRELFTHCESLGHVTFPDSVTTIGGDMFNYCFSLNSVSIPNLTGIEGFKLHETNVDRFCIPDNAETYPTTFGANSYNLKRVYIPYGATVLPQMGYAQVEALIIPDSVTGMGVANSCCSNNYAIKSLTIPGSLKTVKSSAFSMCKNLEEVFIDRGVTTLESSVFYGCRNLGYIELPSTVTSISESAFALCNRITQMDLSNVTTLSTKSLFNECYSLRDVTLPSGLTMIDTQAFRYCRNLRAVDIPAGVTSIGQNAFNGCESINTLTIPAAVTSIGTYAMQSMYGLQELHFKPTTPPTVTNTNFLQSLPSSCVIYVPSASLNTYKTAQYWSTYASQMVGE